MVADTLVRREHSISGSINRIISLRCSISNGVSMSVRAEHELAVSLAEQMEKLGETRKDQATLLMGHYTHGASCYYRGEFTKARGLLEACDGFERSGRSRDLRRHSGGQSARGEPVLLGVGALALMGHIDQGRARVDKAW